MILHGLDGKFLVPNAHDDTGLARRRGDGQARGDRLDVGGERVITGRRDVLGDAVEAPFGVVLDEGGLAVEDLSGVCDLQECKSTGHVRKGVWVRLQGCKGAP